MILILFLLMLLERLITSFRWNLLVDGCFWWLCFNITDSVQILPLFLCLIIWRLLPYLRVLRFMRKYGQCFQFKQAYFTLDWIRYLILRILTAEPWILSHCNRSWIYGKQGGSKPCFSLSISLFPSQKYFFDLSILIHWQYTPRYEGWNFNSGNYLFTTDTK